MTNPPNPFVVGSYFINEPSEWGWKYGFTLNQEIGMEQMSELTEIIAKHLNNNQNMSKEHFTEGQVLEFDCYGAEIIGKFICTEGDKIKIEIVSDSLGVSEAGETTTISKDFLIA